MPNLCDLIEKYLKEQLKKSDEGVIEVRRSELAGKFSCVPSQINYVLETRFTTERGYIVESRRGGGGYIRVIKLNLESPDRLYELIHQNIGDHLSQEAAWDYVWRLHEAEIIDEREAALIQAATRRDVLALDLPARDAIRAQILKAMLLAILRF